MFDPKTRGPAGSGGAEKLAHRAQRQSRSSAWAHVAMIAFLLAPVSAAQSQAAGVQAKSAAQTANQQSLRSEGLSGPGAKPPRVIEAERFLAQRGWAAGRRPMARANAARSLSALRPGVSLSSAATLLQTTTGSSTWQALGPAAVVTPEFGLVSARASALALGDNGALYMGTTGGGIWMANNPGAASPTPIVFTPLTDNLSILGGAGDASISIGAVTAQPGATGVILAGTGDPNDALDSYYGAGILRSADGGNTWVLIPKSSDEEDGLSITDFSFVGLGFAGFAWSTANTQLVVAAVSQADESTIVEADLPNSSCAGLYYSTDSGATWHLATITDGSGSEVEGPNLAQQAPYGNAATSVVWNPVRQMFVAAVRYHGYYQSPDGVTWTRLAAQPGSNLTAAKCPNNMGFAGSIGCPIFRGALAVNPQSGDTLAWTVDLNNQDQGLWQDQCANSGGTCGNSAIAFAYRLNTSALESSSLEGAATIAEGVYNLALAAIPSGQETMVLAGANDLWQCSVTDSQTPGCVWRNTTNSTTCMSAQVGEYQHALAWSAADPLEIFIGNDSGLWRSTDGIAESSISNPEPVCAATDAGHFQNLNGDLYNTYTNAQENSPGSLAEVVSLSSVVTSPYTLMAGLGVNGTAGVKSTGVTADWPQILSGYGGPVAIDTRDSNNWYVNAEAGVAIYECSQTAACTPGAFGTVPVVSDADVGGDGDAMPTPAPFLVDTLDSSQLLVGTCRVWRGPAGSASWSSSNAISPILDRSPDGGVTNASCSGDALIRSMAAMPLSAASEMVYLGMYGAANNGANLPGHVLSAIVNPSSGVAPVWNDLTLDPVVNDANALNYFGLDISSVTIDAHDLTGNTAYVTVEGMENRDQEIQVVYRSTNGGATWTDITANLPAAPANSVAVDPQNANIVYVATDDGVYYTTEVAECGQSLSNCWSVFGTGLPGAPVVALSAAPATAAAPVLVAATYGRGIWQTPLWSSGTALSAAAANPEEIDFASQAVGSSSIAQTVTLVNTGSLALTPTTPSISGDFIRTGDTCSGATVAAGASCSIQIVFAPQTAGSLTGEMTIYANVYGGQLTVDLNGTGVPTTGVLTVSPSNLSFGDWEIGAISSQLPVTVTNSSTSAVAISSVAATAPFAIATNSCGMSVAANSECQLEIEFVPAQAGDAPGQLILSDAAGTQAVELDGVGVAGPADTLNAAMLVFPITGEGQLSGAQAITIANTGGVPLTSIAISVSGEFQISPSSTCSTQLAAGAVCTIYVEFAPTQLGALTGTLTIGDALRMQTVSLSGTGAMPAALGVAPASLTFTNQQPGVASMGQVLIVSNSGGGPMENVGFQLTGSAASNYSYSPPTCGTINNGGSCTVEVFFTPSATGAVSAALAVSSSTSGVAQVSVPLNGTGQLTAGLTTSPTQLVFPVVGAGQSSPPQLVTVTNSTGYNIGSVSLTAPTPFSISQNTCTGSLAAGANCTAQIVFQPSAGGSAWGSLTVSSSAVAMPASVALAGTGFDFTAAVSGSGSQTVAAGQQATFTLVITPSGSSGSFSFACGTLPTNALCIFNPTSEMLSAGVQGNVAVEISTSNGALVRMERQGSGKSNSGRPGAWRALPLACGLLLLPLALCKRRRIFMLVFLAVLLAGGVSSCTSSGGGTGGTSGGTGGQGGSTGTPVGTYTIPVSVTSTGVTQTVPLTLTVD